LTPVRRLAFATSAVVSACATFVAGVWCLGHLFPYSGGLTLALPMFALAPPIGVLMAIRLCGEPESSLLAAFVGSWLGLAAGYGLALGALRWMDAEMASFRHHGITAVIPFIVMSSGWLGAVFLSTIVRRSPRSSMRASASSPPGKG
jgi:hypothetical protein